MEREKFGSRIGFILISAGCAIGLGNVWRFPYIVGQYGGAAFILIYLLFLVVFGLPIMTMELSVGRASQKSLVEAFRTLQPKGTKWHLIGWLGFAGNSLLMMFYTTITGWLFAYFFKMVRGDFENQTTAQVVGQFKALTDQPLVVIGCMALAVAIGFFVCSFGLKNGVERITKVMMVALLGIILVLAVKAVTLPGAGKGLEYYLIPDFKRMVKNGLGDAVFAALGQAFFTLSIGQGAMALFGSYLNRDRKLFGEAISISALDTFVAFTAGLIVIPSCFAFGISPQSGPSLIFETLPNIFNQMAAGRIWGSFFFLFLIFAAVSTVITVFEAIVCFAMETLHWSRKKACLIGTAAFVLLSLPCALGFNLLSNVHPFGGNSTILDLEDFLVSNNILMIGSVGYILFCCLSKKGWGWKNFIEEANAGKGVSFSAKLYPFAKFGLPIIIIIIWIQGYISKFF